MDGKWKTILIQKDTQKGTAPKYYRSMTCLPMMCKILIAQIWKGIYYSLISRRLFPKEQKGYHKATSGSGNLLHIDQHILKESKTKRKNKAIAMIDHKKAYDMVPWSWIINCLKMYKVADNVKRKPRKTGNWIDSRRKKLNWGENPERNLPGKCTLSITICNSDDATHVFRKCTRGLQNLQRLPRSQEKINHLMYMEDTKLFANDQQNNNK